MKNELKKEQAYQQIKDKIISCSYAPGSLLSEAMLIENLEAGRTPIREALSRLEQESLVAILPKKGILVSDITLKEIYDVYHVRLLIEPHIIRQWGETMPLDKLRSYRDKLSHYTEDMGFAERNELDDQLHRMVHSSCPNRHLQLMISHLYDQNQRIRILVGQLSRRMEQNISDHISITDLLLARDFERAATEMHQHIYEGRLETDRLLSLR